MSSGTERAVVCDRPHQDQRARRLYRAGLPLKLPFTPPFAIVESGPSLIR